MNKKHTLQDWIAFVFDHRVSEPAWHWSIDSPTWEGDPSESLMLLAETFERSGELLAHFSDGQLNQGFWYLVSSSSSSEFMFQLLDEKVPWPIRLRALRSFFPLFEQIMAVRCSQHLSHINEPGSNPLNAACYMWWDIIPIHGKPEVPARAEFDAELLHLFARLLTIPHDACRESTLHGIGHLAFDYAQAATIVDAFLERTPDLRPELIKYAKAAKEGMVL